MTIHRLAPTPRSALAPRRARLPATLPATLLAPLLALSLAAGALLAGTAQAQTPAQPPAGGAVATPVGASGPNVAPSAAPSGTAAPKAAAPAADATAAPAAAPVATPAPAPAGLDSRVQDLKAEVIRLNRDLLVLEEELLFPASTQVALFVSMDVGRLFELESVQIKLNDKVVTNYLYTPLEVQALHRGGVQRVYVGNLKTGEQRIDAFFTGKGPHERDYRRATTLTFDKGSEPKYIELRIADKLGKLQPEFEVKVWQ